MTVDRASTRVGDERREDDGPWIAFSQNGLMPRNVSAVPIVPSSSDAEQRAEQRAATARDRGAADDDRGDRLQLEPEPGVARHRVKRTALSIAASPTSAPMTANTPNITRRGSMPGETRRLRVRADGVDGAGRRCRLRSAPRARARARRARRATISACAAAGPSPNHWKSAGRSCTHAPSVAHRSASRHATSIASVTMIDGSPSVPTSDAVERAHRRADAAARRPATSGIGTPALREQARGDAAHRELRADRDVDLADEDDERHPERDEQHRRVVEREVAQVARRRRTTARRRAPPAAREQRHRRRQLALVPAERVSAAITRPPPRRRASRTRSCARPSARASTRSGVASARSSTLDDRAAVHHRDAVAHAEDLGQLGRDHQDGHALLCQLHHQRVNLRLRADVDRPASARRARAPSAWSSSQRLSATFCWLPPDSVDDERADRRRLHAEPPRVVRGQLALAPEVERAEPRQVAERGERDVLAHRHLEHDAVPPAVLGHVGDAVRDRVGGRADAHALAAHEDLAAVGRREPEDRARQLRSPRADQPRQPDDLARAHASDRRRCTPDAAQPTPRSSSTVSPSGTVRFGNTADSSRPTIIRMSCSRLTSAIVARRDRDAVAQHGDAVGDHRQLLEPVRDVDHARRRCSRSSRTTRNRLSVSSFDSDAVGSSRIRTRASAPSARAISTSCCCGMLSSPASVSGSMRAPTRASSSSRGGGAARQSTRPQRPRALEPERDVLRHRQLGEQRGLLIDGRDAERLRASRE